MAGSIKLFQIVQNSFKILGIHPSQANEVIAFNSRNLFSLFCFAQFCILIGGFFILKAETMQEYFSSFFMFSTLFCTGIGFTLLLWRIAEIQELIAKLEKFIEKSNSTIVSKIRKNL